MGCRVLVRKVRDMGDAVGMRGLHCGMAECSGGIALAAVFEIFGLRADTVGATGHQP